MREPLRVLVVTHNYPRFPGDPAGAYVARLARSTAASGSQVRVIVPHTPGTPVDETDAGVAVQRFRYAPDFLERIGFRGDVGTRAFLAPLTLAVAPFYVWRFRAALRAAVRSFAPDVIHAHWWLPAGWLATGQGVPTVITCHGSDVRLLERAQWRTIGRRVLQRAAAVTASSHFLAADIAGFVPGLARPVSVTPMPIDVERFAAGHTVSKATPPRVLYAGNLVPLKGVDVLLRAMQQLKRRGVSCRLKILGEGPERPALARLATELDVADIVDWSQFVPQDRMPAEYGASTVTVLPSRGKAEGLGLVLVEALLAGSAVVGTPAGGIPEVITDGQTGLLARDGDSADLAEQIGRLLADSQLAHRLTVAGQSRAGELFAAAPAARRFQDLYHAVAHRHAAS